MLRALWLTLLPSLVVVFEAFAVDAKSEAKADLKAQHRIAAKNLPRFEALFIQSDDDEVSAGRKASLIRALSDQSAIQLVQAASGWLPNPTPEQSIEILRTFNVVRSRPTFDKECAKIMLEVLDAYPMQSFVEARLRSLRLHLYSQAGSLTKEIVSAELKRIGLKTVASSERLMVLGALTDAMEAGSQKPSAEIFDRLLENDVYEIRMHAVDWFRLSPPAKATDRERFFMAALKTNPYQVRERAYRTLQTWAAGDLEAVKAAIPEDCKTESNQTVRMLCEDVRKALGAKGSGTQ